MPAKVVEQRRQIPGLAKRVAAFRESANLSIQFAATKAGISIPRWRDAESFGVASSDTLQQLAKVGVDVETLKGA